jgi:hypothetical protein
MPVIGDCRSKFRVNVRPTERGFTQQNYGLFHDLSVMAQDWLRTRWLNFAV